MTKVAIIGAGSCGLYLAWKLSEKDCEITVFEKKKDINNKACSGLFSERILDFVPASKNLLENEINSVIVHFPRKSVKVKFSKKFLVMDHAKLDNLLLKTAEDSGAKIILNHNVSKLPEGFDKIIGADGADSIVRQALKLPKLSFRLGIQGFVTKKSKEDYVETWPCKNGFIWRIPRGNKIEYGIMTDVNEAYKTFTEFVEKKNIHLENIKARIIPQGFNIPLDEEATLCGDAAGLTKPWSGGGVVWGMVAADILVKNFPDFSRYSKECKKFFGFKILKSKILTRAVYFVGFNLPFLMPNNTRIESDFLV